ncbi:MAG: 2-oxo acid dehydrogenase subunit E2 [Myxococcota bacterium]|jgi:pyruvate dehydrogenase E2 component (dihydrolipoamide acetyltransferase)|nr:2-oxo acid dehydrogenase subunit E2 [Myxococcota bacterium]
MWNIELVRKRDLSSFRRIAIGTWTTAYDPSVYGSMNLRVEKLLAYIEAFRAATGKHVTLTHLLAKIAAACVAQMPDANALLRFNRLYLRRRIGIFFQVAMQDPETGELDLSGTTVFDADKKSLAEIVDEFAANVARVRALKDPTLEKTRSLFKGLIPSLLLNWTLKLVSFLCYTLNLNLSWAGLPRDPFGSVMVTNIGSLGLDQAFVPLVPYSRVPLLIAVGSVRDAPVVEDGQVVVGKEMTLSATFDHRILDGTHAAVLARTVREWFDDPFGHFDPLGPRPDADGEEAGTT